MIGLFGRLVLNGRQINFGTMRIATINELDQLYRTYSSRFNTIHTSCEYKNFPLVSEFIKKETLNV